jgi:acyl-[acyl-carrier-protein]-phospholipid O-acyltransferase/long-chain-fatty-acid--[acyl-carrier-protein] ligase
MRDGWYITGDIATLDEDGFLTITDRLSRFSKIGGEMVPHGRVEEALQQVAGTDIQVFAVTGIPDERKGEQLQFFTLDESDSRSWPSSQQAAYRPIYSSRTNFITRALPVLGTGKMTCGSLKPVALERFQEGLSPES